MVCPSPDELLDSTQRDHVDGCAECQLIAAELRSELRDSRIGRYRLEHVLGRGGMGTVYAAFDEELHRRVALKLVRPELTGAPQIARRMLREARALAQLSHPNVLTVFEAGTDKDQVFIALELVDGDTLRVAVDGMPRAKAIELVLAAARGLAAIHAAGLVHRDFKPDNVLVGRDGSVRVGDLGLARSGDLPALPDRASASALTRHGSILGTPAYMAPEQLAGGLATAASDQFALCIVLYEVLYGRHPFADPCVRDAVVVPPHDARVPASLRAAVLRGLVLDPAGRHDSVDALLAAIERGAIRRRRVLRAVAAGTAAIAIVTAMAAHRTSNAATTIECDGGASKLHTVWNQSRAARISSAFARSGNVRAADRFASFSSTVDTYTNRWSAMHLDACRATHVRGEQSQTVLDERMACLSARLRELDTHLSIFETVDRQRVERADELEHLLIPVDACIDPAASARAAPNGSESGLVSAFDDGTLDTRFGAGWTGVSDRIYGGSSDVNLAVERDEHANGYLAITGTIHSTQGMRWAGAMFSPGPAVREPANLSKVKKLVFRARGDGRHYGIAMFAQSLGFMPALLPIEVSREWTTFEIPLDRFANLTTHDLTGVMFTTNEEPGAFSFAIDDIKLVE
jgi:serine/threonine protein kinase